jgi:hypothetical protein
MSKAPVRQRRYHSEAAIGHLSHLCYGVGTAQRGWLTSEDVINTWPVERLTAFLRPARPTEPGFMTTAAWAARLPEVPALGG